MHAYKVGLHTLGCKVNQYETDAVAGNFARAGYTISDFKDICDVYVINTCTVTGEAGRKSRQLVHRARTANPDAVVVAMGCHAEIARHMDYADIVLGTANRGDAVEIVNDFLSDKKRNAKDRELRREYLFPTRLSIANPSNSIYEDLGSVISRESTRAFVKIEDGCNSFCSYCIIPYARGRVRSRPEEAIIAEVCTLAQAGYREIVLTGIHICSFGADLGRDSEALTDLATKLSHIEGIERIRFGSLEPTSITDAFIVKIAKLDKLCPQFHISAQSGSDTVLKRMNRKYASADFKIMVKKLRAAIPETMVTTDIITGFPGESDAEHNDTLRFCEEVGFAGIHVFKYSRREGTKAAEMDNPVSPDVMNNRSREIIELARKLRIGHFKAANGSRHSVLIETITDDVASGYTEGYLPVRINIDDNESSLFEIGKIIDVHITRFNSESLEAKICYN